jgi:hypothetical protein
MTRYNQRLLRDAYRDHLAQFSEHLQYALTLTLKQSAKITTPQPYSDGSYERALRINDERLQKTLQYFGAVLTYSLYGNQARHKNKRDYAAPLLLFTTEGKHTHKRLHIHGALGNVPDEKTPAIESIVQSAWLQCDFAYKEVCIRPITNAGGWISYMTKETGISDGSNIEIISSTIPKFILDGICT